jgi:hypothetical protein
MKNAKSFDCVEMKNAIQAQVHNEYEGLDEHEIARRRRQWLETSDSPVAKWWRATQIARQSP